MLRQSCCLKLFVFLLFAGTRLIAQINTGTISGTVTDSTGAVIPGTEVIIHNVETGTSRTLVTNERGIYVAPQLAVGSYEVSASLQGFQTQIRTGITLTVGREAVVDFTLEVGSVSERVEVTGEAPMVETTTATVSGLVDTRQMREIPLNARSFIELVPLQAGAVFDDNVTQTRPNEGFGKKISVSGGRFTGNTFLLDGADIGGAGGSAGSAAHTIGGMETVREFRVITNAYDAEYGKHTGGVISAVTKSGTNEIHGSLFEYLRNDNLDAKDFFDNANNRRKPEYRRNQFGFSLGGPIRKDRTFFFASYEGLREGVPQNPEYIVPSLRLRQEVQSGTATLQGVRYTVSPKIVPYLLSYPLPTGDEFLNARGLPDGRAPERRSEIQLTNSNYWTGRLDHRFSDSDLAFLRYTYDHADVSIPSFNTRALLDTPNHFGTLEHTHIFSPQLLNKTHLSFSRTVNSGRDVVLDWYKYPHPFCNGCAGFTGNDIPGRITGTGFSGLGGGSTQPQVWTQNLEQLKEDFYFTSGRHALKFGGQAQRYQFNAFGGFHSMGSVSFNSIEDFVRGAVNQVSIELPGSDSIRGWRQSLFGFYLHDDIKVGTGLTLNLGVRYEFITSPWEVNGKVANIRDFTEPRISTVNPDNTDVGKPYFRNPSLKSFAPRVGFAWSPFGNKKTSLRGGFGIFDEHMLPYLFMITGSRGAPFYSYVDLFARDFVGAGGIDFPSVYFTQRDRLRTGGGKPEFRILQYEPNRSYVMKWSLDVEHEVAANTIVGLGYSASRGVHLMRSNQATNYTPSEIRADGRRYLLIDQPLRNPNFNRMYRHVTDGTSWYNSLRATVQRRISQGLQFQTSYTWARSVDDGSSSSGGGEYAGSQSTGDLYGGLKWKGPSSFQVEHSFYTNFVYDLPGQRLTGTAGKLFGGWSLAGIVRLNSGPPVNISAATPRNPPNTLQFVGGSSIDLKPGGNNSPIRSGYRDHPNQPGSYFDLSQFAFPEFCFNTAARPNNCNGPSYIVQGNLGRNTLTAPGVINADMTLTKETIVPKLGEGTSLQFRAEVYNLLNRPNFANPNTSVFDNQGRISPTAGRITTTRALNGLGARQIQLALRLTF